MRKRIWMSLFIFLIVISFHWEWQQLETAANAKEGEVIPEESVRLRILAHSDSPQDQWMKRMIREAVNEEVTSWVRGIDNYEEAGALIASRLDDLTPIVEDVMNDYGVDEHVSISYSENVSFPTRLYGELLYPAGEYEAVVVTIGDGKGENWWCVLFPPLCFIEIGYGDAIEEEEVDEDDSEQEEEDEKQYAFWIVEKLKEWFG